MQIKIEIDVKPEELRRFLGLPDVAGLQDDVVRFLRDKVASAGENFDPAAVVQGGLDLLKRTPAWRRIKDVIVPPPSADGSGAADGDAIRIVVDSGQGAARKAPKAPRKRAARKTAAKPRRRRAATATQ